MTYKYNNDFMSSESIKHFLNIALDCWDCTQSLQWGYEDEEVKQEKYYAMCCNVITFVKQAVELHKSMKLDEYMRNEHIEAIAKGRDFCFCMGIRDYKDAAYVKYAIDAYNEMCESYNDEHFESPWSDEELDYINWYYNGKNEPVNEGMSFEEILADIENFTANAEKVKAERMAEHEATRGQFIPYFLQKLDAVVENVESFDDVTNAEDIMIYGKTNIIRDEEGEARCWNSLYISEDVKHNRYAIGKMYLAEDGTVRLPVIIDEVVTPFIVVEATIKKVTTTDGEVKFIGNINVEEPEKAIAII